MIRAFYSELSSSSIAWLFPEDAAELDAAAERSGAFFVGLLGGPPRYHERYGPPMMRKRHMPFPIDEAAKEVWLACFDKVLARAPAQFGFPEERIDEFRSFLADFAGWMVNT